MFLYCRQYLVDKVKEAGIKTTVHTSRKKLELTNESHVGAVLFIDDGFSRNGSKTIFENSEGGKVKRIRRHNRDLTFDVILGDYDETKLETIFESFVSLLPEGIVIDGNYTAIDLSKAEWSEKDDSYLKSKLAVRIVVTFKGGVYKDIPLTKFTGEVEQTLIKEA